MKTEIKTTITRNQKKITYFHQLFLCAITFISLASNSLSTAQNALVGSGFAAGWGGVCTSNSQFKYFSPSIGSSYILTTTANGTGNQYFRLGIDFSGTIAQNTITSGSDTQISPATEYTLSSTCTTSGAMFTSVASTSHQYIFKTADAGTNPSRKLIFFCVQGTVQSISSVSRNFTSVVASQAPTITANLSGALSTGQGVYLRYTTNNWSTSTTVAMTGSGTTYTANIPAQSAGTSVAYYTFTSGSGLTIAASNSDWYTINSNNNSGSNYTYTVGTTQYQAVTSGNWTDLTTWQMGNGTNWDAATSLPTNTTGAVKINTGISVELNSSITLSSFQNDGTLNCGSSSIIMMTNGSLTNNGTFDAGTGTVIFNGNNTVSGTIAFNNVTMSGGNINFGTGTTINGTLTLNSGSFVITNAPSYGSSSTLKYNSGGVYGRNLEWSATSGKGFPNDVIITNNTTLNFPNTGNGGANNASTAFAIARDLSIDAGSSLYMDYGTGTNSGSLTIGRNVTMAGNFSFGDAVNGDVYVGGNWTQTSGTLADNSRAIFFNGTGNQTISTPANATFSYLFINKASGELQLASDLNINIRLSLTAGKINLGTYDLIMANAATVTDYSTSNYIIATSTGKFIQKGISSSAAVGKKTFPIGNASYYTPIVISNSGTSDNFSARISNEVLSNGTSGTALTTNSVNKTWFIEEETAGGSNVTIDLTWNSNEELTSFSSANCYISHYTASVWDAVAGTQATVSGNQKTISRAGITSFSPFSVVSTSPLPIELISFQANCDEAKGVHITWSTASERNSSHFIVEKSVDGKNWIVLKQLQAAGNSTSILNYELIDSEKSSGIKYYRLAQFDFDGASKTFDPIAINCGYADRPALTVYPNPSSENIIIELNDEALNGLATLKIHDAKGLLISSESFVLTNSNLIQLQNLKQGVYFLQVERNGIQSNTVKIIRN